MVSYFVPRGRFLIKAGNLRQVHQRHQQQQQQQQGKWPMLRHFRQSFSTKSNTSGGILKSTNDKNITVDNAEIRIENSLARRSIAVNSDQDGNQQQKQKGNLWVKWTGFLLPIGFCIFGAFKWQLHKKNCLHNQIPYVASEFQTKVYCSLPLRILSRCFGWLAACYIPVPLRSLLYGWYSNVYDVNIEEALYADFKHYNSLSEFFTRALRDGARTIDAQAPLVSPADGKVLHFGSASNSLIEQVKGVNYSIESFLGPPNWKQNINENTDKDYADAIKEKHDNSTALYQCVIYLAPGDYHRFHSPAEWQPAVRRHFAGELLSVSPKCANWLPGLFCINERALYLGKWKYGFFSYTAVGATNVGSVQIYMDKNLKTNRWVGLDFGIYKKRDEYDELKLEQNTKLTKGELVGQFNMGSTIVLLFEAPKDFVFDIEAGQKIRVGERLGHVEGK